MNRERRRELGRTFMDTGKYFLTVGFIGALFSGKLDWVSAALFLLAGVAIIVSGYFIIPPEEN